jgi:hypothetical protein
MFTGEAGGRTYYLIGKHKPPENLVFGKNRRVARSLAVFRL